jgi:molybdate-binding protein
LIISKETHNAKDIANRLTRGYADHGYCIKIDEAQTMGLNTTELAGEELDLVWEIHRFNTQKQKIKQKIREQEVMERIKGLPPDILDKLPSSLKKGLPKMVPNQIEEGKR